MALSARIENDYFINAVTGNAEEANAACLESATQNVTPYTMPHHGLRLVLIDTPGFDNTHKPDKEILQSVADWLTKKYVILLTVSAIPYLIGIHKVSRRRDSQTHWGSLPPPNHG